jgi:hypothetical protein
LRVTAAHKRDDGAVSWDWIDWSWEWLSWARVGGTLALAGGLAAAATFVASRLDQARAEAARLYVKVPMHLAGPAGPGESAFTRYVIVNDGALPASTVGVSAWSWGRRRTLWRFRRRAKWMTGPRVEGGAVFPTIFPGESTDVHDLPGLWEWGPAGALPPIMLVFRDGLGRRWVRWPDGKLTRFAPCWAQVEIWAYEREFERRGGRHGS